VARSEKHGIKIVSKKGAWKKTHVASGEKSSGQRHGHVAVMGNNNMENVQHEEGPFSQDINQPSFRALAKGSPFLAKSR